MQPLIANVVIGFHVSTRLRALGLFLVSTVASTAAFSQNERLFHFTEHPGSYSVGLSVVEQYDYSRSYRHVTDELGRPYKGERARPLQTLIWYPAQPGNAKRLTVGDYARLLATETSFGKPHLTRYAKEWVSALKPTLATS